MLYVVSALVVHLEKSLVVKTYTYINKEISKRKMEKDLSLFLFLLHILISEDWAVANAICWNFCSTFQSDINNLATITKNEKSWKFTLILTLIRYNIKFMRAYV